jgi:hypothetical protein
VRHHWHPPRISQRKPVPPHEAGSGVLRLKAPRSGTLTDFETLLGARHNLDGILDERHSLIRSSSRRLKLRNISFIKSGPDGQFLNSSHLTKPEEPNHSLDETLSLIGAVEELSTFYRYFFGRTAILPRVSHTTPTIKRKPQPAKPKSGASVPPCCHIGEPIELSPLDPALYMALKQGCKAFVGCC